jgi:hypothetical protein
LKFFWFGFFSLGACQPGGGSCIHQTKVSRSPFFLPVYIEFFSQSVSLEQVKNRQHSQRPWRRQGFLNLQDNLVNLWVEPISVPFNLVERIVLYFPVDKGFVPVIFEHSRTSDFRLLLAKLRDQFDVSENLKRQIGQAFAPSDLEKKTKFCEEKSLENLICQNIGDYLYFEGTIPSGELEQLKTWMDPIQSLPFRRLSVFLKTKEAALTSLSQLEWVDGFQTCFSPSKINELSCQILKPLRDEWETVKSLFPLDVQKAMNHLPEDRQIQKDKLLEIIESSKASILSILQESQKTSWRWEVFQADLMGLSLTLTMQDVQNSQLKLLEENEMIRLSGRGEIKEGLLYDQESLLPLVFLTKDQGDESGGFVLEPLPSSQSPDLLPPPPASSLCH